jgi:tetratricopeptide (TPR) repeat protein
MPHPRSAVHRTILVVDVEGFGDPRRTNAHQVAVRAGLYLALQQAFTNAGISWADCRHEDRGDGVFILAPPDVPKGRFVESLPDTLVESLREHNSAHPTPERIRLRMALHAGEVTYDDHGVTAASINLAFRLLEASALKAALAGSPGVLALIVSTWYFDEVVRHSPASHPATYRPIRVAVKETTTVGWTCLPDHPYPSDDKYLETPPADPMTPVPRQLPAAPRLFIGRTTELAELTAVLDAQAEPGGTVVISAIGGMGGIGKTWLALKWAHSHVDRFPDGQLYVNLRGFDPSGVHVSPAEAIRSFLDAFEVAPASIPVDLTAQVALYRTLMADKQMLVLLDNAYDSAQVEPLLPGSSTCTVLVTSRRQLGGLVTAHGARPLALDVLDEAEARQLFLRHLGHDRMAAEPEAVAEFVDRCGGLPLALGILAARATAYPGFPLAVLAEELRDVTARLDALDAGELATNLRAVFSWSYRALSAEAADMFVLLGLAVGPDISLPAAASLAALSTTKARILLRELERAHLVQQHVPGRYRMHDLIKLCAAEHAQTTEARTAALERLVAFFVHTAYSADRLLHPYRRPLDLGSPPPGCHIPSLDGEPAALAWFTAEHPCLLATQQLAASLGWHTAIFCLAWASDTFHWRRGYLRDNLVSWRAAVAASKGMEKPAARVLAHRLLGLACDRAGEHTDAVHHLEHALALAEQIGDIHGRAHTHRALARVLAQQAADERALSHAVHALRLLRTFDIPSWEAAALNTVGWLNARLGNYSQARVNCQHALALFRQHHDRGGQANALESLGYIAHRTNQHTEALGHYRQALALYRDLGDAYFEADIQASIGKVHAVQGEYIEARVALRLALDLYQAQHRLKDAEFVQHHLDALDNDYPRH